MISKAKTAAGNRRRPDNLKLPASFRTFFLLLLSIASSSAVLAGSSYELRCQNPSCRYQASVGIGGGFIFEEISGYCERCQQFVAIRWRRLDTDRSEDLPQASSNLALAPPAPLGAALSPITREMAETYPCPRCSGPFTEIRSLQEGGMLYCPKCTEKTLKAEQTLFYD